MNLVLNIIMQRNNVKISCFKFHSYLLTMEIYTRESCLREKERERETTN